MTILEKGLQQGMKSLADKAEIDNVALDAAQILIDAGKKLNSLSVTLLTLDMPNTKSLINDAQGELQSLVNQFIDMMKNGGKQ